MEIQYIITALLSVIAFFLAGLYYDIRTIKKSVQDIQINQARMEQQYENLQGRVLKLEDEK